MSIGRDPESALEKPTTCPLRVGNPREKGSKAPDHRNLLLARNATRTVFGSLLLPT